MRLKRPDGHTMNSTHLPVPLDRLLLIEQNASNVFRALRSKLVGRNTAVPRVCLDDGDDPLARTHAGAQLAVDPIRENVVRHFTSSITVS